MVAQLSPPKDCDKLERGQKQRSPWRQRLVDAERGLSQGFRLDSTFYGHFFTGSMVLAAAFILQLELVEWVLVILSMTMVLSAEMFNQVLKAVWTSLGHHMSEPAREAVRMGTGAVFVAIAGCIITVGLIFGFRLAEMF